MKLWSKYDENNDGWIAGSELDALVGDLMDNAGLDQSDQKVIEYRKALMDIFDQDKNEKIDLSELSEILQVDDNYLVQFQASHQLKADEFIKLFNHYDKDQSGYLEKQELKGFVYELFNQELKHGRRKKKITLQDVEDYTENLLDIFDKNGDGKIDMDELTQIMPVKESFLVKYQGYNKLSNSQFTQIFNNYDTNGDGVVSGTEMQAFCMDLLRSTTERSSISAEDLAQYQEIMLSEYGSEGTTGLTLKAFKKLWNAKE